MNYTKGRWITYKNTLGSWVVQTEYKDGDATHIALVDRHFNAQLIASAPDLYEALKDTLWLLKHAWDAIGENEKYIYGEYNDTRIRSKAEKALAKAGG